MSRIGFHLLHLFWWVASPSYRRLSRAHKIADILAEQGTRVILTGGQRLTGVHPSALCEGHPCSIHHPSDHHMIEWPQNWRADRNLMERVCQHGVGHPDPDHLAFIRRAASPYRADAESIHRCDGCCHTAWVDVGGGLPWHDYGSTGSDPGGDHDPSSNSSSDPRAAGTNLPCPKHI